MNYFDAQATLYLERGERGLWSHFRNAESKAILAALDLKSGESVLDVGCGAGFYAAKMKAAGARILGLDRSAAMIREFDKAGFAGHVGDFQNFASSSKFDKILI
ncbi:MAG: methyltransferase domain-containing protein, partial [Bdellovibrionia bacterium]